MFGWWSAATATLPLGRGGKKRSHGDCCPAYLITFISFCSSDWHKSLRRWRFTATSGRSLGWVCVRVPLSLPLREHKVGTSSASRHAAGWLEESHCFNYSHIITPINCHVFVNAQEKKKKKTVAKGNKKKEKDGKAEIASSVISPATSSWLWSPSWLRPLSAGRGGN